ncbi:MAG: AAA family ATPase [Vampirovibrio sp.]
MTSYTTLEVQHFKGIREMKLEGLGMVNVFVGGNNVGKTSVLQAIAIVKNSGSLGEDADLIDVKINYRDEQQNLIENSPNIELQTFKKQVFGDAQSLDIIESIYKSEDAKRSAIKIKASGLNTVEQISLEYKTNFVPWEEMVLRYNYEEDADENVQPVITNGREETPPSQPFFLSRICKVGSYAHSIPRSAHIIFQCYCPTDFQYLNKVADFLFGSIKFASKEYRQIMESLKRIEPNLENIVNKECILNKNGETIYLPFHVMGDGFNKLFFLTVVLHHVKKDRHFLLFDEIENGFHWSVQKDMWRMILQAAKDDGTQFFFTTHSYEVLESLNAVLQEMKENGDALKVAPKNSEGNPTPTQEPLDLACVFHLNKDETDKVTAKKYAGEDLDILLTSGAELR